MLNIIIIYNDSAKFITKDWLKSFISMICYFIVLHAGLHVGRWSLDISY